VELTPGDTRDSPAAGDERSVAQPIVFERGRGRMRGAAVEFDDQALVVPDAVALVALYYCIEGGGWEACAAPEGGEPSLELAAREGRARLEDRFDGPDAPAAGVALDEVGQG
jgi:hypothetical protein